MAALALAKHGGSRRAKAGQSVHGPAEASEAARARRGEARRARLDRLALGGGKARPSELRCLDGRVTSYARRRGAPVRGRPLTESY